MDRIELAKKIAFSFLGKPYIWGGDDPIKGFDCSGFIIEILKSVGALPRSGDWTAQGLYDFYIDEDKECAKSFPDEGVLVFWCNSNGKMVHVEFCLDTEYSIGASGGSSTVRTELEAVAKNAYVKVRPINSRQGNRFYVYPFRLNFYKDE